MKHTTRLIIIGIAFALGTLGADSDPSLWASVFNLSPLWLEVINRVLTGLIVAGIANAILFHINVYRTNNSTKTILLMVFSALLFPLTIIVGAIMLIPYVIYATRQIYLEKKRS